MVVLREATRDDLPALAALTRRCAESHRAWAGADLAVPAPEDTELAWDLILARAGAWVRVAQEDGDGNGDRGAIAGVLAFAPAQVSRDDPTPVPGLAHVSALFVDPDRWRRGIARALLDAAEEQMSASGYARAQLWTLKGSPAELLYTALGWERDGRRDVFASMGLPTVAYVKRLA